MKIIREGVFETNSSSSHSLVIRKFEKPAVDDIPRNQKDVFYVQEYGDCSCDEFSPSINRMYSEVDKLSFMLNLLATVCEHRWNNDKMFISYNYSDEELQADRNSYLEQFWDEMINSDLFVLLKEVVFEETGTTISYVRPENNYMSIPFFDCIYIEEEYTIEELLHIDEENFNKDDFKARIKEIIFDKEMLIVNADIPYGLEGLEL